jgi:hypothetical protein
MEATEADEGDQVGQYRSIKMIRSHPITSDHIRSNQTKSDQKNGPARIKAQAVGSTLARANLGFGRARWLRGNAERMDGKTRSLSERNTYFTCCVEERGSGLDENLRLFSLIFA